MAAANQQKITFLHRPLLPVARHKGELSGNFCIAINGFARAVHVAASFKRYRAPLHNHPTHHQSEFPGDHRRFMVRQLNMNAAFDKPGGQQPSCIIAGQSCGAMSRRASELSCKSYIMGRTRQGVIPPVSGKREYRALRLGAGDLARIEREHADAG
jgi:hypothetical protein